VLATAQARNGIILRREPGGEPIGGLVNGATVCVDPASQSSSSDGNAFLRTSDGNWVAYQFLIIGDGHCFQ